MKNIWIIGSSSGIGLELLSIYLKQDYKIIASARTIETSKELLALQKKYPTKLNLLDIDVSNIQSVEEAVKKTFNIFDKIDITIFNAAVYEVMSMEKWNIKHYENMTNINYLGALRLTTTLVPFYEKQGFGRLVFNASLSSYFGLLYGGGYSASKAALVNFAQSIQAELIVKNIEIQIINHGFVKTRLTQKNDFEMPDLITSEVAAKNIYEGINKKYSFEIRFPFKISLFLRLMAMLPYRISLAINKKLLK
ncbi:short-chain dehydrogenase/reductase SDR [Arcobacter nitrofigilis DSM 7299]|uniref:Short-chain dehydrogenase/reductase SDR n=1 Tax=Arcobacter nitrofigilis (strain ATCC 33309 / DSM 7299 / CCUG 15893 / LMG 7604 / NCTC 12251 / CI) TaxID=572480 RepID=D5UZR7_ARCNC|nr:SDR family NAD(P)-dependent oxidoreductase [Arcobacter nitrofigilis]ADG93286.1 short-chain dehydrogenase/reductase SDR [Arcobacter nitrofigilis DSM 7299]